MDSWTKTRKYLEHRSSFTTDKLNETQIYRLAGPDKASDYYLYGNSAQGPEPVHVQACRRLQEIAPSQYMPFEVRLPTKWVSRVAAGYGIEMKDVWASNDHFAAAWCNLGELGLSKNSSVRKYQYVARRIREYGHSYDTNRLLYDILSVTPMESTELYTRVVKALCVGSGKVQDSELSGVAKSSAESWLKKHDPTDSESHLKLSSVLRALAFAVATNGSRTEAMSMIRECCDVMDKATQLADNELSHFIVFEARFPTLETRALCESMWGSVDTSLSFAQEMAKYYPMDYRSWIRLARSFEACGRKKEASVAYQNAALAEPIAWYPCVLSALSLGNIGDELSEWLVSRGIEENCLSLE